jgi:hypothetical protein
MDAQEAVAPNIIDCTRNQRRDDRQESGVKHILPERFIAHCKRIPRNRFALEITLIVIVKALILYGFWFVFFSQPLAKHMLVSPSQMESHMISGTDVPSDATTFSQSVIQRGKP